MADKPFSARGAGYDPATSRDHWVDAVAERVLPPVLLAALGVGLFILGCVFSELRFAVAGSVVAVLAALLVVRIWRRACAEWQTARTQTD